MTDGQKKKRNFRKCKAWKELRHKKNVEQKGLDPVTNKKLPKTATLHHMDLDESHYELIGDETRFVMLNRQTHDTVHWLYRYYKNDTSILERLKSVLDRMQAINKNAEER